MANTKISQLPAATTLTTADLIPVVQGGVTKQVTPDLLPVSTATTTALGVNSTADRARGNHTGTQSADTITDGTTNKAYTATERTKLAGIAAGATVNRADTAVDTLLAAKADLVAGVIPTGQIPALALNTAVTVASQAAMLALTTGQVQPGDVAVRTDGAGTFILTATDPTQLANWTRLNAPTDAVTTVNGQNGTVVLAKTDVGLGNVDNTPDTAKPISTAQQAALDAKAPLASPAFTGTPTIGGTAVTKASDVVGVAYTGNYRGAWTASTAYTVGDVVTAEGALYTCAAAHTSNSVGFAYNRSVWNTVPIPMLHASTLVPARQLNWSGSGVGVVAANPPVAGVFQRRPKQFNNRTERVLKAVQTTADVTVTGGTSTVTNGTLPGGSVVIASTSGSVHVDMTFPATDLTGTHLRIRIKPTAPGGAYFTMYLSSTGAYNGTNNHAVNIFNGGDPAPGPVWTTISVPVTELSPNGTGATLTAVNAIRFDLPTGWTAEISRIGWMTNAADIAKVILWLDDGTWTSHKTAVTTAAKYGLPVTIAAIADNLVNSTAAFPLDSARYMQDHLGAQFAVHAYGPVDHDTVENNQVALEEILDYQHFALAAGLLGTEDGAFWSSGYAGIDSNERHLTVAKNFRSMRGGSSRFVETLPPGDPYGTRAMLTGAADTSAGTWQPYVTRAINAKGLAQFVWHDMSAGILTEFATFCAWLDANRATVQVTTPKGAYDPLCG